ncbi:hypothetical protein EAE96_011068 [Botrytis aclada]|nr:hypothetical protein EAE96_011068 [Botrytis aclada]
MATERATSSGSTSSSAKTAEKEGTHWESDQRVLEAVRPSTTTRPSTIVGTATSSATTSNTSLNAAPSATTEEEKEIGSKSDPRLLEASSTLIAQESEDQDQNQYAVGGDGCKQVQMIGSASNVTHIAPEVGNFASENLLSSSSSSTMMIRTASSTSASISHNNSPSSSRTTMTTVPSASISKPSVRGCENGFDRSSQVGHLTTGSVPLVRILSNRSNSSAQRVRVAHSSFRMLLGVFDQPASRENSNPLNRARPLIVDRIKAFADVHSQANLRGAVSILQQPNEAHSDSEEEEEKESSLSPSLETHEGSSEKSETSSEYDYF